MSGPDPARDVLTLLRGGVITDGGATATSMLVRGPVIEWIGDDATVDSDDAAEVIDLEGRLVTPPFVDAHVHTSDTGKALGGVDLGSARSVTEALDLVAAGARRRPGRPVYAHSWDETNWAEQRAMTAEELDRAGDGVEVYATRVDVHSASASISLMGRAQAWHAPGSDGTGLVVRDAHHLVRDAHRAGITAADRSHFIEVALRAAARAGIGCLHEMGAPVLTSEEDLLDVQAAAESPELPDVVAYWGQLVSDEHEAAELAARLSVKGLAGDLNVDGSIGSRTAAVREPYLDAIDLRGYTYLAESDVAAHVAACTRAGLQAGFHVIGDAGMDCLVAGLRMAEADVGADRMRLVRHRIEHGELCHPEHIRALAELGVTASVQPAFDSFWGGTEGMYAARLGPERSLAANPIADLVGAGVVVALGSDSPVTPFAPWEAMRGCVRHHSTVQRIDARTALALHTAQGHTAAGQDDGGRFRPGSPASYVIWDSTEGLPRLDDDGSAPQAVRTVVRGRPLLGASG
ncbi:amidohydrolase [Luteipulveratus mongoliensis]|uniref:Amidohydrolase 3 domain-containing protein n=1 Tax=Luteipulveratus mongoliensis TaxID=571913 RepID=A0A0K1JK76_9MICO|nr:amidohydrolase family protein [Luteipulveratus mongoliensis]AKU16980.1 hypothetical protein VV02_15815 [Luteipulveratus mongoliensis]